MQIKLKPARLEKVRSDLLRSFQVSEHRHKRFDAPWHFHPEVELTLIVAGSGRRFVGDSLEPFDAGDLVLLGPNLPHFWQSAPQSPQAHAVVVQFLPEFLGDTLWLKPEFAPIARLLNRARQGLHFPKGILQVARKTLETLPTTSGIERVAQLFLLLDQLATTRSARSLASRSYPPASDRRTEARLARIYDYAGRHFAEAVTLPDLARQVNMSPPAFSRYFKRVTGRAPSDFLNDLRIEHTCRLLRETERSVTDIAGAVGFVTLTSFNRRFRERTAMTPREYRRSFHV